MKNTKNDMLENLFHDFSLFQIRKNIIQYHPEIKLFKFEKKNLYIYESNLQINKKKSAKHQE